MGESQGILRLLGACSDWPSIYAKLRDINNANPKRAGTLFEEFAKLYFLCDPTAQAKFKSVWTFKEIPPDDRKRLDVRSIEHGLDLVLKDKEDRLWGVQCKFTSDQSARLGWSKTNLSSWLSGTQCADGRTLFTNASAIDSETLRVASRRPFHLYTIGDLLRIDQNLISAMVKTLQAGKKAGRIISKPRPHQNSAIEAVIAGFKTQTRGQLILPCGAGKTLTALWIKERLQAKRTLVVVPSLSLLKQLKDEWLTNEKAHKPYLCVCSDSTVDDMRKSDYAELNSFEVDENVTTSPVEIRKHLRKHKESVIYSTYQSLDAIKSAIKGQNISFDLIICDEAHRTAGPLRDAFGVIHSDSNIPGLRRLYMTATPRILSPQAKAKLNPEHLELLADMSDPKIFGPEFFRMTFKEAIDLGILVDYKIVAVIVTDKELQQKVSQRAYIDSATTLDEIANNLAVEKAIKKFGITHALTFHSRVSGAKAFIERQKSLFKSNFQVDFVSGELPTNERKIKLDSFARAPKALLANARCLTEGVDVPDIDCVYFCDPRNSVVDIVQATGRALRKPRAGKKKEFGYIVVPTFLPEGEAEDDQIDETAFGNLISVVRAMASQDQRLADEIKEIRLSKGKRKKIPSRIVVDLDESKNLGVDFSKDALEKAIQYRVLSKVPMEWRKFEEARALARQLQCSNVKDWFAWAKTDSRPRDVPSAPQLAYASEWTDWSDWLGTSNKPTSAISKSFYDFLEARDIVRAARIGSHEEYPSFRSQPRFAGKLPANPDQVYRDQGWAGWRDFLGTQYRSFKKARQFARSLKLRGYSEWNLYISGKLKGKPRLPADIPRSPEHVYAKTGWAGIRDWLGSKPESKFRAFKEARAYVHRLRFKSTQAFQAWAKTRARPSDIPANPARQYKDLGWRGWSDWLGNKLRTRRKKLNGKHVLQRK